ncbi:MAG: ABC transporter ATP-binding protein [Proteobacteria bacterium]|nr:ABC transporter ATP-binding protein [Pseudomonadota bacterium]
MAFLEARGIWKTYTDMAEPVEVLRGLDLSVEAGEAVGIFGASGSGKSTLLHVIGGLDSPTEGSVSVAGFLLGSLSDEEIARFRNREVGFVFQFYHLLPEFSALENVMLPALIAGHPKGEARGMASDALDAMGLANRQDHMPAMLSGGEQQRVAIARAAVLRPRVILADEPTGNLDRQTGDMVWKYLVDLNREKGIAIVAVTHNRGLIDRSMSAYELSDGRLVRTAGQEGPIP